MESFYQKHEKVIYYAIGTQWNHKNHTLHEIVKLAIIRKDYGFVFTVKEPGLYEPWVLQTNGSENILF